MGVTSGLAGVLSARLAQWALRRPHILLVVCPGATALRLEAESALAALGGRSADCPADADVLLVLGPQSGTLQGAVDELWSQMPGPRVLVQVSEQGQAERVLREAVSRLSAPDQRVDARTRMDEWRRDSDDHDAVQKHADAGSSPHHGSGNSSADEREEHDGHGGHDGNVGPGGHGEMPGMLPMADVAEDRDGLKLDVLHVPLGPVLPCWPHGLVVRTELQGDIVQWAEAHLAGAPADTTVTPYWSDAVDPAGLRRRVAAAHLDSMSRLLALAGWTWAEAGAVRLRDRLLAGEPESRVREAFGRWRGRVESSVLLRWATDGLGVLDPVRARELGVGGPASRAPEPWDATARWLQWLAETDALLHGKRVSDGGPRGRPDPQRRPSQALVAAVVDLMPGLDLLDARLLMAGFDPDPDELVQGRSGVATTRGGAK